ncbi:uncharacterized protein B0P05DRAFT_83183 [Gilbertella persicaria]|uniref:uncharacterized protein n=1 Tax=Gilbertella persicaria TaxID=101096 RepID=UPI00221F77B3|nr:uncharacterized protein B0P05DRAFT_83183 [Gilbertella persicaria]KAI8080294.1 hypothetical protein B0P05DRAFT_83183 [Gilbertella persicaria]
MIFNVYSLTTTKKNKLVLVLVTMICPRIRSLDYHIYNMDLKALMTREGQKQPMVLSHAKRETNKNSLYLKKRELTIAPLATIRWPDILLKMVVYWTSNVPIRKRYKSVHFSNK